MRAQGPRAGRQGQLARSAPSVCSASLSCACAARRQARGPCPPASGNAPPQVCIEALSVNLRQQTLRAARGNITKLEAVRARRATSKACPRLPTSPAHPLRGARLPHPSDACSAAPSLRGPPSCTSHRAAPSTRVDSPPPPPPHPPLGPLQAVRDAQRANKAKLDAEYQRLVQVGAGACWGAATCKGMPGHGALLRSTARR